MNAPCKKLSHLNVWRVGNRNSHNNDYIVIGDDIDLETIFNLLSTSYGDIWINEDCVQLQELNTIWSFSVWDRNRFENRIADILAFRVYGEIRNWAKGYWLPEGFLIDLMKSEFLSGNAEYYESTIRRITGEWSRYTRNLISLIDTEIQNKTELEHEEHEKKHLFWVERLHSDIHLAKERRKNLTGENPLVGFHFEEK